MIYMCMWLVSLLHCSWMINFQADEELLVTQPAKKKKKWNENNQIYIDFIYTNRTQIKAYNSN